MGLLTDERISELAFECDCLETAGWNDETKAVDREAIRETIRAAVAEAGEEAARIAKKEGVRPELNVYAGGPEWYKHGKKIAAAIRSRLGKE